VELGDVDESPSEPLPTPTHTHTVIKLEEGCTDESITLDDLLNCPAFKCRRK